MRFRILILSLVVFSWGVTSGPAANAQDEKTRPNILWVTSEDNGPHLGCYGDAYADTPNIDRLAKRGVIYRNAWSNAPVCAPARTTLISGLYPTSTGAEHMRSMTRLPANMKMFPCYLREQGYYCTNNRKEDYNLQTTGQVWDESSNKAHWRQRADGQPFFAIFNFTTSHESQIRIRPHKAIHDPGKVRVPPYHPDTKEVRQDWAQYYDKLTEMDAQVGQILKELEDDGLADNTIIFYYGDHGSGMPRHKRSPINSGLNVPLVISIPPKYRHLAPDNYRAGGETDRLVAFIDFAPTVLSLARVKPPEHFQGNAFLGASSTPENSYLHGFRGRMDERIDLIRSVRNKRFVYVRNYMPHRVYGQYLEYMFQTPTTRVWRDMFDSDELNDVQAAYWQQKPSEELYDLENDPDEIHNLTDDEKYQEILTELRSAQQKQILDVRDVGFLPEHEIHARSRKSTPCEMGHDLQVYPLNEILEVASYASDRDETATSYLADKLKNVDSAVRYWAAIGYLVREKADRNSLLPALDDEADSVRVIAAETLARFGSDDDKRRAIDVLLELANVRNSGMFVAVAALNSLDQIDYDDATVEKIKQLPRMSPGVEKRLSSYADRMIRRLLEKAEAHPPATN